MPPMLENASQWFGTDTRVLGFYTAMALGIYALLGAFIWLKPLEAAKKPYLTWFILLPAYFIPLWLGREAWIIAVALYSIYGFKEFAKATGLYKEKPYMLLTDLAMIALALASLARDYGMFMAIPIWGVALITTVPIFRNRYEGAIQHMALSVIGLVYFGWFLGHLGFLANAAYGVGYLVFVLMTTQFNDALAFLWGKLLGKTRWTRLSPNKTVEGSLLALASSVAITFLSWPIAFPHFEGWLVLSMGLLVGAGGQVGDLVMSTFKRDLGVKDFGTLLPGHGGILDRIDSLVWVAPLFFHLARYFHGGFGH